MKNNKKKYLTIALLVLISILIIYICYKLIPLLISLKDPQTQEQFKNFIRNMGVLGFLVLLVIQILQIFIAFIPGEIVELLAGMLYGVFGGLILCLLGILIGSILIYYTVKLLADKKVEKYKEKLKTFSFLNDPTKVHAYLFLLFIIPGIPKDIFIYLVPFLPIKFSSFLIISLIARIPSVISSTIVGSSFVEGNYLVSIIVFTSFALLGVIGIIFKDKIIALFKKHHDKKINKDNIEN